MANPEKEIDDLIEEEDEVTEDMEDYEEASEGGCPHTLGSYLWTFFIGAILGFIIALGVSTNLYDTDKPTNSPQNTPGMATSTPTEDSPPITSLFMNTQTYEIQAGDCWAALANRYNISVQELVALNPQKMAAPQFDADGNPYLYVGDLINVPY